ncbi:NYN domain-containing protein [Bacillus infantis]|uniref:NYN domain-containing protein n=1 Tax=Bacillus infantis TaxID=324767 RepID=UPI003CF8227A
MEKVGVFIDHENIRIRLEKMNPRIDIYEGDFVDRLKSTLRRKGYHNISTYVYDNYQNSYFSKKEILHHYKASGFIPVHSLGIKDSVDMEMSLDAYEKCINNDLDVFVIVSCDKDMFTLIRKLKDKSKKVLLSGLTFNTSNYVIRQSDEFISIEEIMGIPFDTDFATKSDIMKCVLRSKDLYDWAHSKGDDLGKDFLILKLKETLYDTKDYAEGIVNKLIANGILTEYQYTKYTKNYDGVKFVETTESTSILNGGIPNFS